MAFFVFIYFFVKKISFSLKNIFYFLIGIFIPILMTAILLIQAGVFSTCIEMVFFGGTKGSMVNMLIGWIPHIFSRLIPCVLLLIPYLVFITIKKDDVKINTGRLNHILYLLMILFISICIVSIFLSLDFAINLAKYDPFSYGFTWASTMFVLELVIVSTLFFKCILQKIRGEELIFFDIVCLFLGGFAIAVAYGASTSGPINYVGGALIFGLVFMSLLNHSIKLPKTTIKRGMKVFSIVFVAFLIITISASKVVTPYDWWGSSPSPYTDATHQVDVDYFDGIWVSENEKFMYENFEEMANLHLGPIDELYCYANIPIFYTIAEKTPTVKCVVPWFDVSRESAIIKDLEYLKSSNPKMIVFNDHTMDAVNIHEELYGNKKGHHDLYEWLLDCRDDKESKYEVIKTYPGSFNTYLMVLK